MGARQVVLALLIGCAGPRPSVGDVTVTPSPVPGHVRVTGSLVNRGGGGTVQLSVTLHGAATIRADQTIEIEAEQRVEIAVDVAAPAGSYSAEVQAQYPN